MRTPVPNVAREDCNFQLRNRETAKRFADFGGQSQPKADRLADAVDRVVGSIDPGCLTAQASTLRGHPAIDGQHLPGYIGCGGAGQEQHAGGNIIGSPNSFGGNAVFDLF